MPRVLPPIFFYVFQISFKPRYLQNRDRYEPEVLTVDRGLVVYQKPQFGRSTFNGSRDIWGQTFTFDPIFLKTGNKFSPQILQLRRGLLAQQCP